MPFSWRFYRLCPSCDLPYGRNAKRGTLATHGGTTRCAGSDAEWPDKPPTPERIDEWHDRMRERIKRGARVE